MYHKINNNFQFFVNIINLYLESKFVPLAIKKNLKIIRQTLKEKEKIFIKY